MKKPKTIISEELKEKMEVPKKALNNFVDAMKRYEEATGHSIVDVVINSKPERPAGQIDEVVVTPCDSNCNTQSLDNIRENDIKKGGLETKNKTIISPQVLETINTAADNSYIDYETLQPTLNDPMLIKQDAEIDQEIKDYTKEVVVDAIKGLYPISSYNKLQAADEASALSPEYQNYLAECRYHNELMAYAVGQIAYATTAMVLEYNTQVMARNEMCHFVDNDQPRYVAPNPEEYM